MNPSQVYIEKIAKQAATAFEKHELSESSDRRWVIQQRHKDGKFDWTFAAEIIVLKGRAIYVGGDIDHMIFGYGPPDPVQRLLWMGNRGDTNLSYVWEKARIGMCIARDACTDWNKELAKVELEDYLKHENLTAAEYTFALEALIDAADKRSFITAMYDEFGYDVIETVSYVGDVPSHAVIYTQAAIHKLCVLLGLIQ